MTEDRIKVYGERGTADLVALRTKDGVQLAMGVPGEDLDVVAELPPTEQLRLAEWLLASAIAQGGVR